MLLIYLTALIISVLFFILYDGNISFMICAFTFLLPLISVILNLIARMFIKIQLEIETSCCTSDQSVPMKITITNNSVIPVPSAEITLSYKLETGKGEEKMKICTPVFPMNSQTLSAGFSSKHYGMVKCRISSVRIYDFLRLSSFKISKRNCNRDPFEITVLPEALPLNNSVSAFNEQGIDSSEFSPDKPGNDPSEIFGIKEYSDGDKLSRIHWKLTAKTDSLMVKEYSLPLVECCTIVTDLYIQPGRAGREEIYDAELQLAYSLSAFLQNNDLRHSVAVYNEQAELLRQQVVFDEQTVIEGMMLLFDCGMCKEKNAAAFALTTSEDQQMAGHLVYICSEFSQAAADQLALCGRAYRYTVLLCCRENDQPDIPDTEIDIIPIYCGNITRCAEALVI